MSEDVDETVDGTGERDPPEEGTEVETEASAADSDQSGDEDDLLDRIGEAADEEIADEIAELRDRLAETEASLAEREERVDELESRLKRERADFQNYKKRTEERREAERRRAVAALLERLIDVRDNLARALDQDEDVDIREGVESTLRQFDRVLADEDLERIEPDPGAAIDPERHEVLTTVESDQPPGTVSERYRPGYALEERVLRPAQVVASAPDADDDAEPTEEVTDDQAEAGPRSEAEEEA